MWCNKCRWWTEHTMTGDVGIPIIKQIIERKERNSQFVVKQVKGIKITPLRKDFQKVKPLTIVESVVASMTSIMKAWSRNRHVFYSHVDIPELK